VIRAIDAAIADVREQPSGRVPQHLRDAHYPGAARLGHGDGYRYPHDEPGGWVDQEYRPPEVAGRRYFVPESRLELPDGEPLEEG
jgi:putative ATPase